MFTDVLHVMIIYVCAKVRERDAWQLNDKYMTHASRHDENLRV